MKIKPLVSLASAIVLSATAFAAPEDMAQLEVYPKNLARQHLGANLFHYTASSQAYTPTEAAAAWLDDDITTGWPMLAGKQYYLLALPEPELITNFCLSARPASGTINLYAGDEPAPPGSKSWVSLARDIPLESINEKRMAHGFSREAKYVLIETDVADPGPVYSVYLYGEKPAVAFKIQKRDQPIDTRAVFGPFVNEQTSFNLTSLYAHSYVAHADSGSFLQWQKAIDDNPESALAIPPSADKPSVVIRYDSAQAISRIALLADSAAKGKLDFYLVNRDVAAAAPAGTENEYIKASTDAQPATPPAAPDADAAATPTISIVLDGTNSRTSVDFPAVQANELLIRWTPANATDSVNLHELNTFGTPTLATYTAAMKLEAVAALGGPDRSKDSSKDSSKDGKDVRDPKNPAGIGELLGGPYLPGSLGFPPNILTLNPGVPHTSVLNPSPPPLPPSPPPVSQ